MYLLLCRDFSMRLDIHINHIDIFVYVYKFCRENITAIRKPHFSEINSCNHRRESIVPEVMGVEKFPKGRY